MNSNVAHNLRNLKKCSNTLSLTGKTADSELKQVWFADNKPER